MSSNLYLTHATINAIDVDDYMYAAIVRLFHKLGAHKDIAVTKIGNRIRITKKFHFVTSLMPTDEDDGRRTGERVYSLEDFAIIIFRLGRMRKHHMQEIQSATQKAEKILDTIKGKLQ